MNRICLVMVVRDQGPLLRRCIESVTQLIDYWVICNAGSADETRGILEECLKGIPGEVHEVAWVDAGRNRTEALSLANGKAEYHLLLEPDVVVSPREHKSQPSPIRTREGEPSAVERRGYVDAIVAKEAGDKAEQENKDDLSQAF